MSRVPFTAGIEAGSVVVVDLQGVGGVWDVGVLDREGCWVSCGKMRLQVNNRTEKKGRKSNKQVRPKEVLLQSGPIWLSKDQQESTVRYVDEKERKMSNS